MTFIEDETKYCFHAKTNESLLLDRIKDKRLILSDKMSYFVNEDDKQDVQGDFKLFNSLFEMTASRNCQSSLARGQ